MLLYFSCVDIALSLSHKEKQLRKFLLKYCIIHYFERINDSTLPYLTVNFLLLQRSVKEDQFNFSSNIHFSRVHVILHLIFNLVLHTYLNLLFPGELVFLYLIVNL